jgi:hypothetical protein
MELKNKTTDKEMKALGKDYFKLNLPDSIGNYSSGNGEGIWALTDKATKKQMDADKEHGQFVAWACNDSFYYPNIRYGTAILCEFRGVNRPVAVWDNLSGTKQARKNKERVVKKLQGDRC